MVFLWFRCTLVEKRQKTEPRVAVFLFFFVVNKRKKKKEKEEEKKEFFQAREERSISGRGSFWS